jgi:hypothetical protein
MNYLKMSNLAKDPAAVRRTAKSLLAVLRGHLKENALNFLTQLTTYDRTQTLSTREKEFLYSLIMRGSARRFMVGGYRAYTLISNLHEIRLDLPEGDEEFVEDMYEVGPQLALTEKQWEYVFALSREHGFIDHWVHF